MAELVAASGKKGARWFSGGLAELRHGTHYVHLRLLPFSYLSVKQHSAWGGGNHDHARVRDFKADW